MPSQRTVRIAVCSVATLVAIFATTAWKPSPHVRAQSFIPDIPDTEAQLIQIGFQIAPVKLNLINKDPALVGYGSFLVNAVADCNGCHTGGVPPNLNYAAGHNPYFGQKAKVDPTTYLEGGMDFGPVAGPSATYGDYVGPDIIARNLTPDNTGRPEGGHTLAQFKQIMNTGIDFDHLHPTCTSPTPTPTPANCIPPPVDGALLQVMPWPVFHNMTDHQLTAIYEYLSAIPCLSPTNDTNNVLYNDCGGQASGHAPTPADHHRKQGINPGL
ncbi:MAG TPA: hypothetical protein VGU25_10890 [Acidobacteriaceae bacterium]|nr:hypothetical protein [Acidobacteriaceae bacterium]